MTAAEGRKREGTNDFNPPTVNDGRPMWHKGACTIRQEAFNCRKIRCEAPDLARGAGLGFLAVREGEAGGVGGSPDLEMTMGAGGKPPTRDALRFCVYANTFFSSYLFPLF